MNGNRSAAVASLVPLTVDGERDMTIAPTQVSRRPRRPDAAAHDPTKVERRRKLEIDELPTLVVPPPTTMSSGARRRPKEIAEDVASSFDISPFESFEDIETVADVDDDDDSRDPFVSECASPVNGAEKNAKDESVFANMLPPMAQVWKQADAVAAEPLFAIDVALIEAVEDELLDAPERRAPTRARWIAAFVVAASACVACAFVVDERVAAHGRALGDRAINLAQTEIVPELRAIEGRARWMAARSR